jgi:long-chain acyl-CoA synthetase
MPPADLHVAAAMAEAGRRFAGRPAVAEGAVRRDWAETADRIGRASAGLVARGVRPGDRLAILSCNRIQMLEALFAIARAGALPAPLNLRWSQPEIAEALADIAPRLVLADTAHRHLVDDAVALDGPDWEAIAACADAPPAPPDADAPALLLFTGGTTGRSKGVLLSSRALHANAEVVIRLARLAADDRCLLTAPFFHIGGAGLIYTATLAGFAQTILPGFEAAAVLAAIPESGITTIFLAPTMLGMMLDRPDFVAGRLTSIRRLFYGASPMPEPLLRRALAVLPQTRFMQAYGQTEFCPVALLPHDDHLAALAGEPHRLRAAGRIVPGVEVRLRRSDGRLAGPGEPGEIEARGPMAMIGYRDRPEETAATLVDGWIRTGDIGVLDGDLLTLVDRAKDMVVTGAENVYPAEVERVLVEHPAIAACAVIGVPDPRWGERVHAIVVPRHPVAADAIIAFCRQRIAGYKCPRSIEFRTEPLPLTAAGKVAKTVLRQPYWKDTGRGIA